MLRWGAINGRVDNRAWRNFWAPTLTFHDPNQYLPLEFPPGEGALAVAGAASALFVGDQLGLVFDAASSISSDVGVSSLTFSHTCNGARRLLFVGAGSSDAGGGEAVNSVTYNGVAMTEIFDVDTTGVSFRVAGYGLIDPDEGTHDVIVTWAAVVDEAEAGAVSFAGADQVTGWRTPNTAEGSSATPTVNISSVIGDLVVDVVSAFSATIAVGGGQTMRWEQENVGGAVAAGSSTEPGATTVTMSWTITNNDWAIGGVSIIPATEAETEGALDSDGVATVSFAAGSDFSSAGIATSSFIGNALLEGTVTIAGAALVTFVGNALLESTITINGVATAAFVPELSGDGVLDSAGIATVSLVGASFNDKFIEVAGLATVSFVSNSFFDGVCSSVGVATVNFVSSSFFDGVFSSAGVSVTAFVSGNGDAVFSSVGLATVSFASEVINRFESAGQATVSFVSSFDELWTEETALAGSWVEEARREYH